MLFYEYFIINVLLCWCHSNKIYWQYMFCHWLILSHYLCKFYNDSFVRFITVPITILLPISIDEKFNYMINTFDCQWILCEIVRKNNICIRFLKVEYISSQLFSHRISYRLKNTVLIFLWHYSPESIDKHFRKTLKTTNQTICNLSFNNFLSAFQNICI